MFRLYEKIKNWFWPLAVESKMTFFGLLIGAVSATAAVVGLLVIKDPSSSETISADHLNNSNILSNNTGTLIMDSTVTNNSFLVYLNGNANLENEDVQDFEIFK